MSVAQAFDRRSWGILIALIFAEFTAGFETTMVVTALKTFLVEFRDPIAVGWLVTSYLLVSAASAAICGKLGDMYGRRPILLALLGCALVGSLISALSSDIDVIIIGRAIQGLSGAILPLCFGLAREALPPARLSYSISAIASTAVVASGFGGLIGGVVVEYSGYHAIFLCSATLATVSIVAVLWKVPSSTTAKPGGDLKQMLGGLMFAPGIFGLLLAISQGSGWGWTSPLTLSSAVVGFALLAVWLRRELTSPSPLINVRMLSNRTIALAVGCAALYGLGPCQSQLHILLFQQPTWTGSGVGLSPAIAALYASPGQFVVLVVAPLTGWLCYRFGARGATIAAAMALLMGWVLVISLPSSLAALILAGAVMAFGATLIYSAMPNAVVGACPENATSEMTALIQVARSTFQAVGAQLVATIHAAERVPDPMGGAAVFPTPAMVTLAISFVMACAVGMLLCGYFLPRGRQAGQTAPLVETQSSVPEKAAA